MKTRKITITAMLGALSTVLMFLSFPVPIMPPFIKLDFSELPALIASFAFGPLCGAAVCFIKNAVNVLYSTTGGIGEISNFILGMFFVVPAGIIYGKTKTKKGAFAGAVIGAVSMAVLSVFSNYFIVYPIYEKFSSLETILNAYRAINPKIQNLWQAILMFNMPFTFVKGMLSVVITFLIYKRISPLLKGKKL